MKYIAICLLLLTGCVSSPPVIQGKYHITINVMELIDVRKFCKADSLGCVTCFGNTCSIYVVNNRECIAHEIDHVLYGEWHSKEKRTCRARAITDNRP